MQHASQDLGDRLKAKLGNFRGSIDLERRIAEHPLPAVGIAFALGAIVGLVRTLGRGHERAEAVKNSTLGGAITGAITALAMRMAKDYALSHLSGAARKWIDTDQTSPTERKASRDPSVESFLEH